MSGADIFMMILIAGAACWLLYNTLFKKKGGCHSSDCSGCSCSTRNIDKK